MRRAWLALLSIIFRPYPLGSMIAHRLGKKATGQGEKDGNISLISGRLIVFLVAI